MLIHIIGIFPTISPDNVDGNFFCHFRFCLHFADRGVEVWINDLAWLFFISTDHLLFVLPNSFMYKSHLIVQSCGLPHCFCCKQSLTSYSTVIPDTQIFLLVGWWVDNKIRFAYQIYSTLPNLDCNPEEEKKKKRLVLDCRLKGITISAMQLKNPTNISEIR